MQYVYLIKCQHFYKIGIANDVESRLAQLSTGNPFPLEVLAVFGFDNASAVEIAIHQRFSSFPYPDLDEMRRVYRVGAAKQDATK